MINIKLTLVTTFIIILLSGCTYQRINLPDQKSFFIQEINVSGDSRSAFIIKKKINRFSNIESQNKIVLDIELTKRREIQEKNIQNKITKYKVKLSAKVEIKELNNSKLSRFYSNERIYDVAEQYSTTVNNAKNVDKELIDLIVDQILDELKIYFN
jgi:predicted PilT family ATPase|tara:strand:+ start:38 stop:505 length:468 start_codon:yes stop_codon:yes gene_type:complete